MNNNKQTTKCTKCKKDFTTEIVSNRNELICINCKKKTKRKYFIVGLVGLCLVGGGVGLLSWNNYKQSNVVSFDGIGEVNDSISVEVQNEPIFKMENLVASKAVVDGISGSVDNIESFNRWMEEEVNNAEKNNKSSISIPAISFTFEKNSSDISSIGKELISEFEKYYLKTDKTAVIEIEGYACNLGSDDFNNNLSKNRAEIVKEFLMKNNISANHMVTKWYGKSKNNSFNYQNIEDYRRVVVSIEPQ